MKNRSVQFEVENTSKNEIKLLQVKNEFQSVREIYHMICQQTEAHNSHHRPKSGNNKKLQTV